MSCQRILLIFLILRNRLASGTSVCSNNGNYTSNSMYKANLNTVLLTYIPINFNSTIGFYSTSAGQTPDKVNALVLCRSDVHYSTCVECIRNATDELLQTCPNQKQAICWHEVCMLRYSDKDIYGTLEAGFGYYWVTQYVNVTSPVSFKQSLGTLLDGLQYQAANGGSLRKIAAGNATAPDFQTIYSLVQCTPDLSAYDCITCLIRLRDLQSYFNGFKGVGVAFPSCTVRYETNYHFYNETRLQELQLVSLPPVPLPPPPPPLTPPPPPTSTPTPTPGTRVKTILIIVGSIVAFGAFVPFVLYFLRKKIRQKPKEELLNEIETATAESLHFDFSTIRAATHDFSDDSKLGQGGFGAVYKGKLPNNREIAVKRLSIDSRQGDREFKNEVVLLANLQHRNLVKLLGFSIQGTEKLIIYEFLHNGSLNNFIFGLFIVISKLINVLLDAEMNSKITDFGLARLLEQDESRVDTSKIVGTRGYIPPEYATHGQFSFKSDVFSFGVIVLEVISGQRSKSIKDGENVDLVSCAWKNWREGTPEKIIDPELRATNTFSLQKDILRCIHIGLLCIQENVANRPTMRKIIQMLDNPNTTLPIPEDPALAMAKRFGSKILLLSDQDSNRVSNV
ncbi:hypothetical protein ABFS82_13G119800 [Erythranthe guttata]